MSTTTIISQGEGELLQSLPLPPSRLKHAGASMRVGLTLIPTRWGIDMSTTTTTYGTTATPPGLSHPRISRRQQQGDEPAG
jgi:hypothetical protein